MVSSASHLQLAVDERRRRNRLPGDTIGWVLFEGRAQTTWEVRIVDVTRHGVGFTSFEPLTIGEICKVRIGRGPIELARMMRIVHCTLADGGSYLIGGAFI